MNITDNQKNCIDWIESTLDIEFKGNTKKEASEFIGKYLEDAKLEQELEGVILESKLEGRY